MAGEHRREVGIAPGREHGERMAESPQDESGDPLLEPEPERRGTVTTASWISCSSR